MCLSTFYLGRARAKNPAKRFGIFSFGQWEKIDRIIRQFIMRLYNMPSASPTGNMQIAMKSMMIRGQVELTLRSGRGGWRCQIDADAPSERAGLRILDFLNHFIRLKKKKRNCGLPPSVRTYPSLPYSAVASSSDLYIYKSRFPSDHCVFPFSFKLSLSTSGSQREEVSQLSELNCFLLCAWYLPLFRSRSIAISL